MKHILSLMLVLVLFPMSGAWAKSCSLSNLSNCDKASMIVMIKDIIDIRRSANGGGVSFINDFYDKLDNGQIIEARKMYEDNDHLFKELENWDDTMYTVRLYGFKEVSENTYKYRVVLHLGWDGINDYEVVVLIRDGKLVPLSVEKVVEEVYSSSGVKYVSLQGSSQSRIVSRKDNSEREIVKEENREMLFPYKFFNIRLLGNDDYLIYDENVWELMNLNILNMKTGHKDYYSYSVLIPTSDEKYFIVCPSEKINLSLVDSACIYDLSVGKDIYELKEKVLLCQYDKESNRAVFTMMHSKMDRDPSRKLYYSFDTGKITEESL